jgi:ADP-ribose pyrophosphatase YjhB (NUDIX family)
MHKPRVDARPVAMIGDAPTVTAATALKTPYAAFVRLPTPLRRLAYRCAYALLCTYRFIVRPRLTGVKCVLTDGDLVLLVRHTYGPREWDLPGGGIKRREPPATAAQREMQEELGVALEQLRDMGEVLARLHNSPVTVYCFRAELRAPALAIDRGEIASVRWFPQQGLPPNLGRLVRPVLTRSGIG